MSRPNRDCPCLAVIRLRERQSHERAVPEGSALVAYRTSNRGREHMNGKSRGPERAVGRWWEAPDLLAICKRRGEPAEREPGDETGLSVFE